MKYEEYCEKVKEFEEKCAANTLCMRDYNDMISLIGNVDTTIQSQDIRLLMYSRNVRLTELGSNVLKAAKATQEYLSKDYVVKDTSIKGLVQLIEKVEKGESVDKNVLMAYVNKYDWCCACDDWGVLAVASQTLTDIKFEAIYNTDLKLALSQSALTPFSDIEPEKEK